MKSILSPRAFVPAILALAAACSPSVPPQDSSDLAHYAARDDLRWVPPDIATGAAPDLATGAAPDFARGAAPDLAGASSDLAAPPPADMSMPPDLQAPTCSEADGQCNNQNYLAACGGIGTCFAAGCCCPMAQQCRAGSFPVCCPQGTQCLNTTTGHCG